MWISRGKRVVKQYCKIIRRRLYPLSQETLLGALRGFGEPPASYVNVHSSLSRGGQVTGGASAVIGALHNWVGGRNLVMPSHTCCYPEPNGDTPIFDPQVTASVVGQVTDFFWRQPGAVRSLHPTHSMAAIGPDAEGICANHESCDTPCGKGTPYERLIEQDCATLMFGVTMNVYTFFHTAEDAAGLPFLYEEQPYALK